MWIEPTRRLTFNAPITYEGRYGASVVALVLGGYLLLNTNPAQIATGAAGLGGLPLDLTILLASQFSFAVLVIVFGLAVAPATSARRVAAILIAVVLIVLWAVLTGARVTGSFGPTPPVAGVFATTSFITPLVIAVGWLIVRERPGLTYLLLILTLLGGIIPFFAVLQATSIATLQVLQPILALVLGVGIAWLARLIAGAIQHPASETQTPSNTAPVS
jgi:hypothetical protein